MIKTSPNGHRKSKETGTEGSVSIVEFVRFFPYQVPQLQPGMTGLLLDAPSLGSSDFEVKRSSAHLRLWWATIQNSKHRHKQHVPEFSIALQDGWAESLSKAKVTFYNGIVIYGKVKFSQELQVDKVLEDRHTFSRTENQESVRNAYVLIQMCLSFYNDLMDAYRSAHADLWTPSHLCLHETWELVDFRSLSSLIQPTRRLTLPDFVDCSFFRLKCGDWIAGSSLLYTSTGTGPPDASVNELTQKLLHSRRVTWARYLLDAAQYVLDGETGLAVVMANVAIELALKELLEALLKSKGVKYKSHHLRQLLEAASFNAQLKILVPLSVNLQVPDDVLSRCNELRAARNNLLHWGRGSGSINKVLSWVDAARDVCVRCEELLVEYGVEPSLVRHETE